MDGFEEKKWFIYLGDHHEGPFSLQEIQTKMGQGQVSASNYIWSEGMSDWKLMTEVSAFQSILQSRKPKAPASEGFFDSPVVDLPPAAPQEPKLTADPLKAEPIQIDKVSLDNPVPRMQLKEEHLDLRPKKQGASKLFKVLKYSTPLLVIGLGATFSQGRLDPLLKSPAFRAGLQATGDAIQPILLTATEKLPVLTRWISPIGKIADISPADYEELKAAASSPIDKEGARLAIGLSMADPNAPSFYVAGNMHDGSAVDIFVIGVPDTLLYQLSFETKVSATLSKRLGKSGVATFLDGKALPKGQYDVYAIESDHQPGETQAILNAMPAVTGNFPALLPKGFKVLAQKSLFLGGPKDDAYIAHLKEFHDRLRQKATDEINELKLFETQFETELSDSGKKFHALSRGKPNPKSRKVWAEYQKKYGAFAQQISKTMEKWTPETLSKEFFYGKLYDRLVQAYRAIDEVHQMQNAFFTTRVETNAFEIQLGQKTSLAMDTITELRAKIEHAEKMPPTPNGMPRREDL